MVDLFYFKILHQMIPVTQTKVVVRNSEGIIVQNGNCFAAAIASILELPITEVPNVEVFFRFNGPWYETMDRFLRLAGWDLVSDDRFKIFHDGQFSIENREEYLNYCKDKYYLVSGPSLRGVHHVCIYRNGKLVHDPHPTREGLLKEEMFQELIKVK
jgi:hypothetical protein